MSSPLIMEGIKQKAAEEVTSSSTSFEPKPFFWDSILFYLASMIFGLSVSSVVVDFFKSSENSLACFSPLENRAQYTYINSYCHKYLPVAEYFSVALVIHATALLLPHYLWKVFFNAKFHSFFSHAIKLDTLRDRDTGEYPHKNYSIVDYLQKEFHKQNIILTMYVTKLLFQFLLMLTCLILNIVVFTDINFNITFECYDDNERSQLFGNVTCVYPKKLFINVLQVADYLLLTVAIIVLGFGLYWCVLFNHSSEDKIVKFCYDSCIDAKYYKSSKSRPRWNQLKNDFKFLVDLLLVTNTGLGRLFNSILIEKMISQKFNTQITDCASRDIKEETPELEVFRTYYEKIRSILPVDELLPKLVTEKIITVEEKLAISADDKTENELSQYLLDHYIVKPLSQGDSSALYFLLDYMNTLPNCEFLVDEIKYHIAIKMESQKFSGGYITELDLFRAEDKRKEKPTSSDLQYVVDRYAYDWKELGIHLHLEDAKMPKNNHQTDVRTQCREMLEAWLNTVDPTWDKIFSAISRLVPLPENEHKVMNQSK